MSGIFNLGLGGVALRHTAPQPLLNIVEILNTRGSWPSSGNVKAASGGSVHRASSGHGF